MEEFLHRNEDSTVQYKKLFGEYYEPLIGFAQSYLHSKSEAEDVVQTVFAKLWKIKEKINYDMNVKSLLFTSTKNRCISRLRTLKYENRADEDAVLKYGRSELALEYSTTEEIELNDLMGQIDSVLDRLSPEYRLIFEKNRTENKSYIKIAEDMNISVKTVEKKVSKILKLLKKELSDYDYVLFFFSF